MLPVMGVRQITAQVTPYVAQRQVPVHVIVLVPPQPIPLKPGVVKEQLFILVPALSMPIVKVRAM